MSWKDYFFGYYIITVTEQLTLESFFDALVYMISFKSVMLISSMNVYFRRFSCLKYLAKKYINN